MKNKYRKLLLTVTSLLLIITACTNNKGIVPETHTVENKPWTYWWWMGSIVTKDDISAQIKEMSEAGMGGVHIIPIYGVKGQDENEIPYLSDKWVSMLDHTLLEASRYGMKVDMTTGTGWPFGGPNLPEYAKAKKVICESFKAQGDRTIYKDLTHENPDYEILKVIAVIDEHTKMDLAPRIKSGDMLAWPAPIGDWTVFVLYRAKSGQNVKRPAPGGEGHVLDHFSDKAFKAYSLRFDSAFAKLHNKHNLRAVYNDSYEVFSANWTDDFFLEFENRRGYKLEDCFYALFDTIEDDYHSRVLCDYQLTIAELLKEEFISEWVSWAHKHKFETRNQSHGSPGNLLDLYSISSMPETESFGASNFNIPGLRLDTIYDANHFKRPSPLLMKFASSASNLNSRKYTTSETSTWLGNHFEVSLSQIKPQIDELFISGINHIFYHGMTYSPKNATWPGYLFYASTNYNYNSHFWEYLPYLNKYITNCQALLQNSSPDNDILVYFPIYDIWSKKGDQNLPLKFDLHKTREFWYDDTPFKTTTEWLYNKGYSFDYISDDQILDLYADEFGKLGTKSSGKYKTLIIPDVNKIPVATLEQLYLLANNGANIVFMNHYPANCPGYFNHIEKISKIKETKSKLIDVCPLLKSTDQLELYLLNHNAIAEEFTKDKLSYIRKNHALGKLYFITNLDSITIDKYYSILDDDYKDIEIYDVINNKRGKIHFEQKDGALNFRLQLQPDESCFIIAYKEAVKLPKWEYYSYLKNPVEMDSEWKIEFTDGKPNLPPSYNTDSLYSWTLQDDDSYKYYSGNAKYSNTFTLSEELLSRNLHVSLGDVRESAIVWINGEKIGAVWAIPFLIDIPKTLLKEENTIEIEVTNLSANRIIGMDKNSEEWRIFKEINFVDIAYKPFDFSTKDPVPSGLLGPVVIY